MLLAALFIMQFDVTEWKNYYNFFKYKAVILIKHSENDNMNINLRYPKILLLGTGGKSMVIQNIHITGVGGIRDLYLEFKEGLNVICGVNGVGKTTILNCINDFFIFSSELKRNTAYDFGNITLNYMSSNQEVSISHEINVFKPINNNLPMEEQQVNDRFYVLNFGSDRDIKYEALKNLTPDPDEEYKDNYGLCISQEDIKNWFISRYAFVDKEHSLTTEKISNFKLAVENFNILDDKITFKTVDGSTYDIILNTPDGDIYFEYLSSGYKSCIYIILGIIKEIEYRFKDKSMAAKDFNGVILIDEIDIHLHPLWQSNLLNALKSLFPLCQIIVTTHSPSVLQALESDEIIALDIDENNNVYQKELALGEYGLQGWTLEEILTDVMGLPSTNSKIYEETITAFDKALDDEDYQKIKFYYDKLDKMLHPTSTLRRILKIQMAGMEV